MITQTSMAPLLYAFRPPDIKEGVVWWTQEDPESPLGGGRGGLEPGSAKGPP